MTDQPGDVPSGSDALVVAWLESSLDAKVVSWQRQPRWRPMWFAELDRDDALERVVVRGERSDTPLVFPLEHEMLFQQLLDEHGIPVPKVHGWCDQPRAYAMAAVPGRPDFAEFQPTSERRSSTSMCRPWPGSTACPSVGSSRRG